MKQNWRIVAAVSTAALFMLVAAFVYWASDAIPANDTALQAMKSDSQVSVSPENGWVVFYPAENPRPETGFIFYPGGKVDYRAYAPVLKLIAARGYFVVVVPVPLNLAFFDVSAASRVEAARQQEEAYASRDRLRDSQLETKAAGFRRAMSACLEGRGYSVR